ncbi:Uncharacterised protein [Shigella flexneri]|uniref:Uncharacterized protein n=1 Tax=Shigella flexneri TaxID=623 RepID=A0A2Y4Z0M1_SHIFL|nr:Uncharacterised protein [Shigella flexneri]SVH92191.1 Uncharacterised protein [Shigella flexneri]
MLVQIAWVAFWYHVGYIVTFLVKHISIKTNDRFYMVCMPLFAKFAAAISAATTELHAQFCTLFFRQCHISFPYTD